VFIQVFTFFHTSQNTSRHKISSQVSLIPSILCSPPLPTGLWLPYTRSTLTPMIFIYLLTHKAIFLYPSVNSSQPAMCKYVYIQWCYNKFICFIILNSDNHSGCPQTQRFFFFCYIIQLIFSTLQATINSLELSQDGSTVNYGHNTCKLVTAFWLGFLVTLVTFGTFSLHFCSHSTAAVCI